MKTFLYLLSATVLTTSTITPITSLIKTNINQQEQEDYTPDSFKNLIKMINTKYSSRTLLEKNPEINEVIDILLPNYYQNAFNDKSGTICSWDVVQSDDQQILWTFSDTFRNNSPHEQIYNTESYSKSITNTHSFSISISEKISVKTSFGGSFKIPFIDKGINMDFEITTEVGHENKWSNSTTEIITVTAPSQAIKASPYSILKVLYIIRQGWFYYDGILNFEIKNWDEEKISVPIFYFNDQGQYKNTIWKNLSISEVIEILDETGYLPTLKNNNHQYSVLTIDDIENPKKVYFNLPISWQSQGGKIDVSHTEEPLN